MVCYLLGSGLHCHYNLRVLLPVISRDIKHITSKFFGACLKLTSVNNSAFSSRFHTFVTSASNFLSSKISPVAKFVSNYPMKSSDMSCLTVVAYGQGVS